MSNEHMTAIKETADSIRIHLVAHPERSSSLIQSHLDDIDQYADAIARQLAAAEARCEAYKQGWDALAPFCTKQFRGDDPSITDEELHAFCVARRTIWELEHGDLPESEATDEAE